MNRRAAALLLACALPTACSGANYGVSAASSALPAPSPSASPTTAPGTCGVALPGSVLIAIGSYIEPQVPPDATYGVVSGYALTDAAGNYPLVARPIVLKPNDVVQFVNVDPPLAGGAAGTPHSASGLQTASFPNAHVFPTAAAQPTGSSIDNVAAWSTGELPAVASALCYSQRLQLPASGVYYFGDYLFYNAANMRDVIVISAQAAS